MQFVLFCFSRLAENSLRLSMLLVLLSAASAVGCSSIDLPPNANIVADDSHEDAEHLAEVRETALADPFPTAAEAGLDSSGE